MKLRVVETKPDQVPASVVAVDDDPQILAVLSRMLPDCGYRVACVEDGLGALQILESEKVDVLLCDMLMPRISGLDLLEATQELRKDVAAIMMSAYPDIDGARRAFELGAGDFLVKPINLQALPIVIDRCLLQRKVQAERDIEQRNQMMLQVVKTLSAAIGAKDCGTAEHCGRMARLAMAIGDTMGLSASEKGKLELAAYAHDIGKISVNENILAKKDGLSEEEWREIRSHPETGRNILLNIDAMADIAEIVRCHHERIDGKGYPRGLSGERIPLLSRILAVVDAFDAMISDRPYRRKLSESQAIAALERGSGTQFDRKVVEVFVFSVKGLRMRAA